jgi:hypothetical protein
MKATHTSIASNFNDLSTASVSKAGDIMIMVSASQKEEIIKKIVSYQTKTHLRAKPPP